MSDTPLPMLLSWCIAYHWPSRGKCRCGWEGRDYQRHIADGILQAFDVTKKEAGQ